MEKYKDLFHTELSKGQMRVVQYMRSIIHDPEVLLLDEPTKDIDPHYKTLIWKNLDKYLLEKTDIFCLIMEEKYDEADLLNSILIETEVNKDNYFQDILYILLNPEQKDNQNLLLPLNYFEDLIFLYSAMLRIAELPLNEKFLEIDPNNLSIPIILSNETSMDLRLRAANKAFLNKLISIDSLAALYQSVDFTSEQLNDPAETIKYLNNNEFNHKVERGGI